MIIVSPSICPLLSPFFLSFISHYDVPRSKLSPSLPPLFAPTYLPHFHPCSFFLRTIVSHSHPLPTSGVLGPAEVVYPPTRFYNMLVLHHYVVVCPSESEYVHITIQNVHEYMVCLSPFLTLTSCKSKQLFVTVTVNFIQKVFFQIIKAF
jgi:hypothetical protein